MVRPPSRLMRPVGQGPVLARWAGLAIVLAASVPSAWPAQQLSDVTNEPAASRESAMQDALQAAQQRTQRTRTAARPGRVSLVVDGRPVEVIEPILVRDGVPFVPIREAAAALFHSLVNLGDGSFRVIAPNGESTTVRAQVIDRVPVIPVEELGRAFGVRAAFDPARGMITVTTAGAPRFRAALIEKPADQLQQEAARQAVVAKSHAADEYGRDEPVPDGARPAVDLDGQVAYTYINPHLRGPFRSVIQSLAGRAYNFDMRAETVRKDINGVMDHDYSYVNFRSEDVYLGLFDQSTDLYPLRTQSQAFNGVKLVKSWTPQHDTTISVGETETNTSGVNGAVKYLGHLYEAKHEMEPAEWARLRAGVMFLDREADLPEQVGESDIPRDNVVSFTGAEFDLPHDFWWTGHMARSDYEPDNASDTDVQDYDWRTELGWDGQRARSRLAYEFVGDRYATVGDPNTYQDYSGLTWYGDYRVTDNWWLSGSALRYHNDVDDEPNVVRVQSTALTASSRHQITKDQSVNFNYSHFLADPDGPSPGSSSESDLYRVDYFLPFFLDSRLLANYQMFVSDTTEGTDSVSHTVGGSLFKSFAKGSSWYLSQQYTRGLREDDANTENFTTSFNVDYRLTHDFSSFLNTSYARDRAEDAAATNTLAGSVGLRYQIVQQTAFNAEYSVNNYNLKTEKGDWPRDWQTLFYVSQSYGITTAPTFGALQGIVFEDANANGVLDPGEHPVEAADIWLEDRREVTTGNSGFFRFSRVLPGTRDLKIDLASIDPEWTVRAPELSAEVKKRQTATVYFGLIRAAAIQGFVYIDDNRDGRMQDSEEPVQGVAVLLLPGEQFRRTEDDGSFEFANLLPGTYTILARAADVPTGYRVSTARALNVELGAGEAAWGANFGLQLMRPEEP